MKHFSTKKFLAALALGGAIVFAGTTPAAQATVEISAVVKMQSKVVNWNKGSDSEVLAVGIGRPDSRGLVLSREAAIMAAQRNLVGVINGLQIDSDTTMKEFLIEHDTVTRKISGILQGAQVVEEDTTSDGGYYVVMRVPLYGKGSISAAVMPEIIPDTPEPFEEVTETELNSSELQTLQTVTYTGVIVDASGLGLDTTFSPVIYDTNGRAIYGVKNLSNSKEIISHGMVSYSTSLQDNAACDRAGSNPLIVKAVEIRGGANSVNEVNCVVSVEDGDKILLANEKSHMLENCAVVFVK
jgi:hypothetical protein